MPPPLASAASLGWCVVRRLLWKRALVVVLIALACTGWAPRARPATADKPESSQAPGATARLSSDVAGSVPVRQSEHLRLTTDLGNIVIHTQTSDKLSYRVHLEADASQKNARQLLKNFALSARRTPYGVHLKGQTVQEAAGRLWVTWEVSVPKDFNVAASTGGGNIELDDIGGRIELSTAGGNITAGNIDGSARLETNGGHVTVKNVSGDLISNTGGGHITTGAIGGAASLRTSGGHIRAASVGGAAHLFTGGGNVALEHSGGELFAETSGGQIEVGEASGLVRAKTGGGGIRVVRVSGPSDLHTVGGNIYLTQVDSTVKASTAAGGITAWFVMPAKQHGDCDLQSSEGDIVVYLPRQLPVTIDAQIQMADEHRVIVDPVFPIRVSYDDLSNGLRVVRAEGSLNGGGEVLRLRAVAGNIRVVLSDAGKQVQLYNQQMELLEQQMRQLRLQLRNLLPSQDGYPSSARR
jgi:DUF4097 and DUF4098 domain-containing protein YvlB